MLNRLTIPVINDEAIKAMLAFLKYKKTNRDTTLYEVGYMQCQQDLAELLINKCGLLDETPISMMEAEIKRRVHD